MHANNGIRWVKFGICDIVIYLFISHLLETGNIIQMEGKSPHSSTHPSMKTVNLVIMALKKNVINDPEKENVIYA